MVADQEQSIEEIVSNIESKLEMLEDDRDDLRREVDLKRAQIRQLTKALAAVRDLEEQLDEL